MNTLTHTALKNDAENRDQDPIHFLPKNNVETMQTIEDQLIKIKRINIEIVHMSIQLGEHREYTKEVMIQVKERGLTHDNRQKLHSLNSYKVNTSFLTKRIAFLSQELAEEMKTLGNLLINSRI